MYINVLAKDFQKFGYKEVFWRIINGVTHSEASFTKKLIEKDKYYQRLTPEELV